MVNKGYMVFSIPFVVNFIRNVADNEPLDLTLLVVAVVTSVLGSSMQITHKNLAQKKDHKPMIYKAEVWAIYITGVVFGLIGYVVGDRYEEIVYTMLIGVFGSYMSLDLFESIKKAVLTIVKNLPDALVKYYLNNKDNSNK